MKKTLTLILCSPFFISCVSGTSNSDIIKKLDVKLNYDEISGSEVAYTGYSIKNQKYLIDLQNAGGDTFKLDLNIPSDVIIKGINYSVTVIGRNEFPNVYVRSVDIPNSVTRIGQFAFAGCAKLENIVIPNSVTHIGSKAFEGCVALRSLVIPASVTSLGAGVFSNCKNLETITFENPEPPYSCSQDADDSSSDIPLPPPPMDEPNLTHVFSGSNVKTVYVPAGAVDTYKEYFSLILGMEIDVLPIK